MVYIKNAKVVLEDGILWDGVIAITNNTISAVGDRHSIEIPCNAETIDAGGLYVGPGFVDIHVHGGGGSFFYQEPDRTCRHFLSHGETSILPTLYYDLTHDGFLEAIDKIKAARNAGGACEAIAGLYMEGPYMNPKYGACPEKNQWCGPICPDDYEDIVDHAGSMVRVWAVAPEREGLEPFIAYAAKVNPGVTFSVGHSEATPAQISAFKKYGLRLQTHCMDATGRLPTFLGTRSCGPDEACFLDPDFYAEVICDSCGIHVHPDMIRLILRNKGVDKVVLITDSFHSNEMSPESLRHVTDLVFDANGDLNGSKLTLDIACRNLMSHSNCGICQAFLLASRNPARVVGLDQEVGSIETGKRANLVFVDDEFHVHQVMLNGEIWRKA